MTELTLVFLAVSLLLYVILGGADFGAGILEIFTGKRGINTISKAIAPVWEANHIWLIVIVVIGFNAFPIVYSTASTYLHIPIMLVLLGIIFRGTAFTFRYYDPYEDRTHKIYTNVFKAFSVLTPFFLGITFGSIILGKITIDNSLSFAERFVAPWLNFFSFSLGIFVTVLFAFLAAIFLIGEHADEDLKEIFIKLSKRLMFALVGAGLLVFLAAEVDGLHLFEKYWSSSIGILSTIGATLLIPLILLSLRNENPWWTRLFAGAQTAAVTLGWFGIQLPVLIPLKNAEALTIENSIAPLRTVFLMNMAIIVGLALVIPLLVFLFKVFKGDKENSTDY